MKSLEELIEEYCPDGVEFVPLGKLMNHKQPTKYIVKSTNYIDSGIPVLTAGQTFILGYTNETEGIYNASKDNSVIIFDDFTASFRWVDFNFKVKSSALKILISKDECIANLRYIFYAISTIRYIPDISRHERQWISKYTSLTIPLPPIEIQRKIVEYLDRFTELTKELTKELTARRKQYEYYRDKLLNFEGKENVRWMKLDDIGGFYSGLKNKTKQDFIDGNMNFITYMNVFNNIAINTDIDDMVKIGVSENQNAVQLGDIIFTGSSENLDECGMSSVLTLNLRDPIYLNSFCFGFRMYDKLLLPGFSKYLFRSKFIRKQIVKTANGVTRFNISKKKMKNLIIPLPPIEEQERIVEILDKFDLLVNDITNGLPAEIEAREKQYEYYRDKLLTFKEKKK